VVDLETTSQDHGDPRTLANFMVDAAVSVGGVEPVGGLDSLRVLSDLSGPVIFVAHNAKFELGWLNREGFDTTQWLPWDTMLAEYVMAGNRSWRLGLDATARRYGLSLKGRLVDRMMQAGVCPSEMPAHLVRERVLHDVRVTRDLFYLQRELLERDNLTRVMFTRCITTPVLAHIEAEGMNLNAERVAAEYERLVKRRHELSTGLSELAGGRNLRSGPQMAELIYDKLMFPAPTNRRGEPVLTASGRRPTDKNTLAGLTAKTKPQREFLTLRSEFGKVDAALSKSLEFFQRVCAEGDGSFVATFNQAVTQTHRLSSSGTRRTFANGKSYGAQFQNLAREYKKLFKARRPGWLMVETDGAQLEFRVGGHLGRDEQVLRDVVNGEDIHRFTASVLFNKPEAEITPKQRTAAKPDTFKPLYGGQSGTKRQVAYYEAFRQKYSGVFAEQTRWTLEVLRTKELVTATGLKFYWPDTRMRDGGYIQNTPSIFNYPVQSLATADIIPVSLVYTYWDVRAAGIDAHIVNTVHDSVIAEVSPESLDRYREVVVECFLDRTYEYLDAVYGIDLFVPLGVGFKAGEHWGEGEEQKFSYEYRRGYVPS
jgi:DNA polymerase I-like protein with 3'-5' exonuclease and polymerase domains